MVNNQQPELQIVLELLKAKNNRLMAKTLHFSWGGVVIKKLVQKLQKKSLMLCFHMLCLYLTTMEASI